MELQIKRNPNYAEANITVIGITKNYGTPQFVLVNSDEGKTPGLKFPGLRFRAPQFAEQTLEDSARERFEEQTGLRVSQMLGLRAIVPTRSRHNNQWIFRNVFLAEVDASVVTKNDGREIYLADPGQGINSAESYVCRLGNFNQKTRLEWVVEDNKLIAEIAQKLLHSFDWDKKDATYYRKIPCVGAQPQTSSGERPLGCGLAVATMMLLYRPHEGAEEHIILLKRKQDEFPGYVGGKIETPDASAENIDPISCCSEEGSQEYGFKVKPLSLICTAVTPCHAPSEGYHNSIVTYAFVASPTNPLIVRDALANPRKYLEDQMECYVNEGLGNHKKRVEEGRVRMVDNISIGTLFFNQTPSQRTNLEQIVHPGII